MSNQTKSSGPPPRRKGLKPRARDQTRKKQVPRPIPRRKSSNHKPKQFSTPGLSLNNTTEEIINIPEPVQPQTSAITEPVQPQTPTIPEPSTFKIVKGRSLNGPINVRQHNKEEETEQTNTPATIITMEKKSTFSERMLVDTKIKLKKLNEEIEKTTEEKKNFK